MKVIHLSRPGENFVAAVVVPPPDDGLVDFAVLEEVHHWRVVEHLLQHPGFEGNADFLQLLWK